MSTIDIYFWGVRGSCPAPSAKTIRYGGNTPCIEIIAGGDRIICGCGTGIRRLGELLSKWGKKISSSILISHVHWDHISGLPFFVPLYDKKNSFEIIGPKIKGTTFKKALTRAISPPYFPVNLIKVPATLKFKEVNNKSFNVGKIKVKPFQLSHPGGALGWRFEFRGGKSLIYISDNEPDNNRKKLIRWAKGADIMIHDAQYTPAEYNKHKGWGHSPYTYPIEIAKAAGVKKLILSHFDPKHTDNIMDEMLIQARKLIQKSSSKIRCELAREGKSIRF